MKEGPARATRGLASARVRLAAGAEERLQLHARAADLQVIPIDVAHVKTVCRIRPWLQAAALQFRFDRAPVPILYGVCDVVDSRRIGRAVPRNEHGFAESHVTFVAVVVVRL